ncbi:hypothetical protein [Actinomadura sp. 9N407]|uniref:hypothetical protein n=1 Tax=Actinomadura sp. 9N407 TaxID=3375154 RepID=UPI0037A62AF8
MSGPSWSRSVLVDAAALSEQGATTVAKSLVAAGARGIPSHDLMRVPMYVSDLVLPSTRQEHA